MITSQSSSSAFGKTLESRPSLGDSKLLRSPRNQAFLENRLKLIDSRSFVCLYCAPNFNSAVFRARGEPSALVLESGKTAGLCSFGIAAQSKLQVCEVCAMGTGRSPRRLTEFDAVPRVCLSGRESRVCGAESNSTSDSDASDLHSRDVYVLLSLRQPAGVLFGIDSEAISEIPRPTRPKAWWVFSFCGKSQISSEFRGHRWRSG